MPDISEISIDDLIRRIYKSYVEIKVGEFRDIDRDMLLSDIGLLYTNIKNLYPSQQIPSIEFDLNQKALDIEISTNKKEVRLKTEPIESVKLIDGLVNENKKIEEPIDRTQVHSDVNTNSITNSIITKGEERSTSIDLSIFDDEELLESEESNLIDQKSDNTNSPILQGFQTSIKVDGQKIPSVQDLPTGVETNSKVGTPKVEEVIPDLKHDIVKEKRPEILPIIEQEKKSTNDIMDFLHHDDKKASKDIYSLLDLNTRIGLIELFFKGNSMELTECLVWLNKLDTMEACLKVINKFAAKFGVAETEDIYKQLVSLAERKLDYK